jgi:tRNA A-37 threonylcarbamoyl transferase component Bud32
MRSESNNNENKLDRIIYRPEKGVLIKFFPDRVTKNLSSEPQHPKISRENQTHRLINEIAAYKRFNELKCPFVPKLLDYSIKQRWLAISRIDGENLLLLLGNKRCWLPTHSILRQINEMNHWLRNHNFGNMENNLKDLILDSTGNLYLIDFEPYSPNLQYDKKIDIYETIIFDILERILIRTVRKVQLTRQFLFFSVNVFLKRPIKTVKLTVRCLMNEGCNSWLFSRFVEIWRRLKSFF